MSQKQGTLREFMPQTASVVDWLRKELGKDAADKLLKSGKAGRCGFWAREIGPDGVEREFGSRNTKTKWPGNRNGTR